MSVIERIDSLLEASSEFPTITPEHIKKGNVFLDKVLTRRSNGSNTQL